MIPYHTAMKDKRLSLGMFYSHMGIEMIPALAGASINHLVVDHMFSRQTWDSTANIFMAARLNGVTPFLRVQTFPWAGDEHPDFRVVSEVCRGRRLGAAGAVISISSAEQLRACMHASGEIEHNPWIGSPLLAAERYAKDGWKGVLSVVPEDRRAFPLVAYIEDVRLLDQLDEIVSIEGLGAVGLGMTDLSHSIGQPYDVEHPDVWRVVDEVVKAARPRNISVWANTGWGFPRIDQVVARIERLYRRGVDSIQLQPPQSFLQSVLSEISDRTLAHDEDRGSEA